MTWFFAVLIVVAMGVVAVVAAGKGGSMSQVYDDRPDSRVQAEGPLTPEDLRRVRFSTAFRGYRMSEVDSLLDRLAEELDAVRRSSEPTHDPLEPHDSPGDLPDDPDDLPDDPDDPGDSPGDLQGDPGGRHDDRPV